MNVATKRKVCGSEHVRVKHVVLRLLGVLILALSLSAGSCPGGRNPDRFGLVAIITGPPNEVISL
jgi:hypothetical protein